VAVWQVGVLVQWLGKTIIAVTLQKIPYAIDRYVETNRLYGVLDRQLREREYIAGNYSIADILDCSLRAAAAKLEDFPNLKRWFEYPLATGCHPSLRTRPAVHGTPNRH